MHEVFNKIFGSLPARYLPMMDSIISAVVGTHYTFKDFEDYKQIINRNFKDGMRIYWTEILARAHIAAVTSILRNRRWIEGVLSAFEASNLLSFTACMRGFLESAADSHDALDRVPGTLARNHLIIQQALDGRMDKSYVSPELEDMLIHFSHARKLSRDEAAPQTHKAKSIRDYLAILEKSGVPKVFECYSFLCDLTHPGALSVWVWFNAESESDFSFDPNKSSLTISSFCSQYRDMMLPLFMYSFNSAILTLAVLNHFSLKVFHCKEVSKWNLSDIKAWRKIKNDLLSKTSHSKK